MYTHDKEAVLPAEMPCHITCSLWFDSGGDAIESVDRPVPGLRPQARSGRKL